MITCKIPRNLLLSANGRMIWQQKASITKMLRESAYWLAT